MYKLYLEFIMNDCILYGLIHLFIGIPMLILMIISYQWLIRLEKNTKCDCSKNYRRTYLRTILFIWILTTISYIIYTWTLLYSNNCVITYEMKVPEWLIIPRFVFMILVLIYLVFVFQYIRLLKARNCECAMQNQVGDEIIRIHASVIIYLIIISVLLVLFTVATLFSLLRKNKIDDFKLNKKEKVVKSLKTKKSKKI